MRTIHKVAILLISAFYSTIVAETVTYHLVIAENEVNITGSPAKGMTINGQIPGPTVRFTEGDTARIHVTNKLDHPSSIHWHGLLVPPQMDGVPFVTFPPIQPGETFTYEFPIRHSGTYWYHSHSGLQEQSGVYGSIVIDPTGGDKRYPEIRDFVVLASDWTDTDPHKVMRTLRTGSEYYAIERGIGQSILGAAKVGKLGAYFQRELQRMPPMDIADVAYDQFLLNGMPASQVDVEPGETVRLRLINGSASSFFHFEFAGGPMTVIAADGIDVEAFEIDRLLVGIAETYDVLVKTPPHGQFELRATAHDRSGHASIWFGEGARTSAPDIPHSNSYESMGSSSLKQVFSWTPAGVMGMPDARVEAGDFDKPGMNMGGDMSMHEMNSMPGMDHSKTMDHSQSSMDSMGATDKSSHSHGDHTTENEKHNAESMSEMRGSGSSVEGQGSPLVSRPIDDGVQRMTPIPPVFNPMAADLSSREKLASDGGEERPWSPYDQLRSLEPTALDTSLPTREIRLTLDGDMGRYVWFINNKPLSRGDSIRIAEGENVRFIMINRTMMHHPMHLHGHFFRVVNGQGDYAPLKHTVDVTPMSTTVIEFPADEKGDWFFHCHLLYHMHAGMARVVEYEDFTPAAETQAVRDELFKDDFFAFGRAFAVSNMTSGWFEVSDSLNIFRASWEYGWNEVEENEWEGILTYGRYKNRFLNYIVGADFLGEGGNLDKTRGLLGISYLMPLSIGTTLWADTDGGSRIAFMKEFEIAPRVSLELEAEYDTHRDWEGEVGLNYFLSKNVALHTRWQSEFQWGGGFQIWF